METLAPGKWAAIEGAADLEWDAENRVLRIGVGTDLNGVRWTGPVPTVPTVPYVVDLEARRLSGSDFFCGLTFPVADKPCSLILGGWGGNVCGLSNLDYYDAANNETTRLISFENGKWYHVRLRVTPKKIQAWLDDEDLVDVEIEGRKIGIRPEVDLSQPLGIATWQTAGAVRNIVIKPIAY